MKASGSAPSQDSSLDSLAQFDFYLISFWTPRQLRNYCKLRDFIFKSLHEINMACYHQSSASLLEARKVNFCIHEEKSVG